MTDKSPYQINLLDVLAFLVRWRKLILTAVFSVAIVVAVISYVVTPKYRSIAIIRAQEVNSQGLGSLIASKLGAIGGLASFAQSMSGVSENTFVAILKSRWMSENAINAFDLRKRYKIPAKAPIEAVIKALNAHTDFQLDQTTMNVVIYCEDESPKQAKEMVDFFISQLDKRNQDLRAGRAAQEKEFIGQRLDAERNKLRILEDSLYRFQVSTGVLDVKEQVRATMSAVSALQAERLATQSELDMKNQILGPSNPESEYIKMRLSSIDGTLKSLIRKREGTAENDFLLHLEDTPAEGMTYLRLARDLEIQQLLVGYLLQQFEQAKIDELRNTATILRVDPPTQPETKIWPRRGLMVLLAGFGTFIFSAAAAMIIDFFRKASADPNHPQHEAVLNLRQSWKKA
jgi:uncharacterized protein involved in exopolysaccharide biosynthesis